MAEILMTQEGGSIKVIESLDDVSFAITQKWEYLYFEEVIRDHHDGRKDTERILINRNHIITVRP